MGLKKEKKKEKEDMKVRGGLWEHGQKNDAWLTTPWGAVREAPGRK